MANTYQWVVTNMECYPSSQGQQNVVFKVYYYVEAFSDASTLKDYPQADGTVKQFPYQATYAGEQDLTYVAGSPFTPYNQLTNDTVVSWIQAALGTAGVAAITAGLDASIQAEINPTSVSPGLPW